MRIAACLNSSRTTLWISSSSAWSRDAVLSSKMTMRESCRSLCENRVDRVSKLSRLTREGRPNEGEAAYARAIAMSCRCPAEKFVPPAETVLARCRAVLPSASSPVPFSRRRTCRRAFKQSSSYFKVQISEASSRKKRRDDTNRILREEVDVVSKIAFEERRFLRKIRDTFAQVVEGNLRNVELQ